MKWKRFKITALALVVAATLMPQSVGAQDTSIDHHLVGDQSTNYGRAVSESALGGSLGWGESYYLESYMSMYEATRDKYYLDKVVDHTDRMLANANDHDSDGNLSWADHRYSHLQLKNDAFALQGSASSSAEMVVNGSFETDTDADGIPDGWTRQGSIGGAYRSVSPGHAFEGTAAVILESDGTNENRLVQELSYLPNATYEVEAFMSVDSEASEPLVEVYNTITNKVIGSIRAHHVGFERYLFTFKAPVSGKLQLRLSLENYEKAGFKGYIDNVSVKAVDEVTFATVLNGDMEALDSADPTLPADWTRFTASTAANVYASTDSASGNYSIAITTDNTSWEVAEQVINYVPSQSYTLKFQGKVSSTAAYGRVQILNATDNISLGVASISSTSWTTSSVTFTAPPVPGKAVKIRLMQNIWSLVGFTSYFDHLELYESFPAAELAANPSFETVDGSDATLPLNWARTVGTTSSHAYQSSGINNFYTGLKGIAIESSSSGSKGVEQVVSYSPGKDYVLSYWGRTTHPSYPGTLEIYNETDNIVIGSLNHASTLWTRKALAFTAPATSGKTLKLRVTQPASAGGAVGYVDVVSVKPLQHTEAAGWTRDSGTLLSAAHRSNNTAIFPADDAGLELVHDGTTAPKIYQELYNYKPNSKYGVSFAGLASAGAAGQVRVYDVTASATLGSWSFSNTDKLTYVFGNYVTPAAGHELILEVSLTSGSAGNKIWLDSFKLGQFWDQMVQEGIILSPVLRFVNAVKEDSALHAAYLTKAQTYTEFVADNMIDKWNIYWKQISGTDGADNGTGLYIMPAGFSTEWAPGRSLPHNQYLAYARMLYLLHDATEGLAAYAADRPLYLSRANDMARAFKGKVYDHPLNTSLGTDANMWVYWDPMGPWDDGHYFEYTLEDLSHAGLTMTGPMEAYYHGQVFTWDDMVKFTRTLTDIMWNQSLTDTVLSWQNSRQPLNTVDKERMVQFAGWTHLMGFNSKIWDIAFAICEQSSCTPTVAGNLAKWSKNKLSNSGFERVAAADPTLPNNWTRFLSTPATAALTNTDPGMGKTSLLITSGTTWQVVEQKLENYEPNTPYTISFMGKRYGSVGYRAQLYDYTSSTILGQAFFTNTSWTRHEFNATTPAAGHDIRVRVYNLSASPAGQSIAFDDVHANPSLAGGQVANAGFETANRWDSTLARYWVRGASTLASNAVLDTANQSAGLSSIKLVSAGTGSSQELSYTWLGYLPGAAYTVSFDGQVSGAAGGRVQIIDTTTSTILVDEVVSATSWTNTTATFTAPNVHNNTLKVILTHNNPSSTGTFWVDQLSVTSN